MMSMNRFSRHEGVSCDACGDANFSGVRHKCLACYDFDLCDGCARERNFSAEHSDDHPVQRMASPGVALGGIACPHLECDSLSPDPDSLLSHWITAHSHGIGSDAARRPAQQQQERPRQGGAKGNPPSPLDPAGGRRLGVSGCALCPICAIDPAGDPNRVCSDLAAHLVRAHGCSKAILAASVRHAASLGKASGPAGASSEKGGPGPREARAPRRRSAALALLAERRERWDAADAAPLEGTRPRGFASGIVLGAMMADPELSHGVMTAGALLAPVVAAAADRGGGRGDAERKKSLGEVSVCTQSESSTPQCATSCSNSRGAKGTT